MLPIGKEQAMKMRRWIVAGVLAAVVSVVGVLASGASGRHATATSWLHATYRPGYVDGCSVAAVKIGTAGSSLVTTAAGLSVRLDATEGLPGSVISTIDTACPAQQHDWLETATGYVDGCQVSFIWRLPPIADYAIVSVQRNSYVLSSSEGDADNVQSTIAGNCG